MGSEAQAQCRGGTGETPRTRVGVITPLGATQAVMTDVGLPHVRWGGTEPSLARIALGCQDGGMRCVPSGARLEGVP